MTNQAEIVIYQNEDGKIHLETRLQNETLWVSGEVRVRGEAKVLREAKASLPKPFSGEVQVL